ncbi:transcription factor bHLH25-like [Gastrolobium bilobum]|uniref:transcription factor bHLH25-like n=1 Tax=Gastrolobium bilobum TaxID=150636 RepID=UPI002AB2B952|nr:transcription factor bHLH25-like [Gastrolobium bilobum]
MDESWGKWISEMEMDDLNSLEEEFEGVNSLHPEPSWNSHFSDLNFTIGNSSLEENNDFDNPSLKQLTLLEKPLFSSSISYTTSFEHSTEVPNIPKTTCHNHDAQSKETQEEPENRNSKKDSRSSAQIPYRTLAERKRRENLTRMFIALSASIPGLKRMDKVSILNNAIDHVKYLQKRVKDLEEQNKKRKTKSVDRPIKTFPNVKASISGKDVLIRVMCQKQKNIVPKLLAKLKAHNLSLVCSNAMSFGNSIMNFTSIAQILDHEFSMTKDDLVKTLNEELLECCDLQH